MTSQPEADRAPSKRICVIGAGPAGLAVLKYLSQTSYFKTGSWSVIAFESRSKVGGVWFPAPPIDDPPLTPLYDSLTTNLPHPIMGYTEYLFPPSTPLFPEAATVQTYLESYASHFNLIPLIRFNISVTHATWINNHWRITTSTGEALEYDNLVVANGHYRLPNVPDIPGLDYWITNNMATHSAWYRRPHAFGRKVLVVGAGPSGNDIAAEMRNHAQSVIHAISGSSVSEDEPYFKIRGKPLRFYDDGRVLFEQGIVEENVDHCILATGFQMDFPFFDEDTIHIGDPPLDAPGSDLYNSHFHVFPLAKYLFPLQSHYPVSSLAFMALLFKVAPLPIAEAQARAIVRAFADPASLDLRRELDSAILRSRALIAAGACPPLKLARAWFRLSEAEQWSYRDELFAYAAESGDCPAAEVTTWEKEMYANKNILRTAWVELEKKNEAQDWVKGIGEGGVQEWVEMMYRLLRHARNCGGQGFGPGEVNMLAG